MAWDLLLTDCILLTPDRKCPDTERSFLAIEDGRIAALGPIRELPATPPDVQTLALPGRLLTPGFVNIHTHAVLSLMRGIAVDMGHAPAYTPGVPHGHEVGPEDAVALARLGALEALTFGSTIMVDSYVHADLTLPAMAELGIRVHACGRLHDVDFTRVHQGIWRYDDAIGAASLQAVIDLRDRFHGAYGGRTHVVLTPHAPDTCSDALLSQVAALARQDGMLVATHLSQSPAENAVIADRSGTTPTALLDRLGLLNDRLIAAHCIHMTADDIARFAASGATVAHVPKGNATSGRMAPTPLLRAAGARLALGTDNLTQDMIEAMRWALIVARLQSGDSWPDWQPEDVFGMATAAGAAALGRSDLGQLRPGAAADLVVIDARQPHLTPLLDPLGTLVHDGQGRDVEHVFVAGRQVIRSGQAVFGNAAAIRSEAQAVSERLWARARTS